MPQPTDPFRRTDELDSSSIDAMATRLEARGRHPYFARALTDYLDRMEIDRRLDVLDLGCGTGVAARAIAQRPGFSGSVLGIDRSEQLIQNARSLAGEEKLDERVRFETGDSHALQLADGSFDAVVAHTLFSHLDSPASVLEEIRRVLRSGGVVGIFDGDYQTLTFELGDPERSERMDHALVASLVTNPRVLRRLPRLLRQTGFVIDAVLPTVVTEAGVADVWKSAISAYAKLAPRAGLLTDADWSAWNDELIESAARGEFFGSCVYYAYVAHVGPS